MTMTIEQRNQCHEWIAAWMAAHLTPYRTKKIRRRAAHEAWWEMRRKQKAEERAASRTNAEVRRSLVEPDPPPAARGGHR